MLLSLVLLGANGLYAQHDDMYYDPQKDKGFFDNYKPNKNTYSDKDYSYEDEEYYDDEAYDYYDDYDYYYSSRIRRFHRPYYGFNFFDPVYVDMSYYDPFLSPGMTMLIYDDVFAFNSWYRFNRWNSWNRWNRWNNFGWYGGNSINFNFNFGYSPWNSWGYNSWNRWDPWYSYNSWNSPFSVYNYYNFGGGGYYCPPTWGNNYVYNTVNNIRDNTYYGPRMGGTTKTPGLNGREIRRETPTDVTNSYPNSTTGVNLANDTKVKSVNPADPEREVTGREKAHTERISIFDEKEKSDYGRTIEDVRNGRTTEINRRDLNTTEKNNSRIDRRWSDNNRTNDTRTRTYDPNTRTRDYEAPRTRSNEPTRRSDPNNEIRRNNDNNRSSSSSPSWNNTRSSSPRSDMGSSRSSGSSSPSRSSGSNNSGSSNSRSSSGSNNSSSSKRGNN